ncbi:MAG TPA: kynureninase [Candidatus Sulfotelmatobacter sp.]
MTAPPPQMASFETGEDFALAMDARDSLKECRDLFFIPKFNGADCVYLSGHSLGLQPKSVAAYIQEGLNDWAELGVEGHFHAKHPWMPYHRCLREQTAKLVGGKPDEVVVMNSLTVNLHLMMVSFYRPTSSRNKILIERGAFPSDQYAVKSQIRFHGYDPASALIELGPLPGESYVHDDQIESLIERSGDEIALILFAGVNYATGQFFNLEQIVRAGHARGCIVGFDLAHAAGNLPLNLHTCGPDFAVWCSYKYLNGGPGCVAGCFVHERHANAYKLPRFTGWWGHDEASRFQMGPDFRAMAGAEGWQLSNPPIVSLASLRASMDIFHRVGMQSLRVKSVVLTNYLEFLLNERSSSAFSIITPYEPARRGAQISIRVPRGRTVCDQLTAEGVICDWREPDILRVAPIPLYNSFHDVFRFVQHLRKAVD